MGRNIRFLKSDLEPFRAAFKQDVGIARPLGNTTEVFFERSSRSSGGWTIAIAGADATGNQQILMNGKRLRSNFQGLGSINRSEERCRSRRVSVTWRSAH